MNRSLFLEDFASSQQGGEPDAGPAPAAAASEDEPTLDAYEAGYKNGWADCAKAEAEERKTVGAHLAKQLREAELTYETARNDVFGSLDPFFEELIGTLLPRVAAEALGPVAAQELRVLLEDDESRSCEIIAAPASCESLQRLLDAEGFENASVRAEPAYAESQVSIRVGTERRDIDLSDVTEKIVAAIRAFQTQIEEPVLSQGAA